MLSYLTLSYLREFGFHTTVIFALPASRNQALSNRSVPRVAGNTFDEIGCDSKNIEVRLATPVPARVWRHSSSPMLLLLHSQRCSEIYNF